MCEASTSRQKELKETATASPRGYAGMCGKGKPLDPGGTVIQGDVAITLARKGPGSGEPFKQPEQNFI